MKLSAPKKNTWIISIVLAVVSLVSYFIQIPYLTAYTYWVLLAGFVLLCLGAFVKGL